MRWFLWFLKIKKKPLWLTSLLENTLMWNVFSQYQSMIPVREVNGMCPIRIQKLN